MATHPSVSPTTKTLSADVFSRLGAKARASGQKLHPLHVGDTYKDPPPVFQEALRKVASEPHAHSYTKVHGDPELLDAVGKRLTERFGRVVGDDEIQIVNGATAGLSIVAETLLDPGDDVLLPSPYWPLIRGIFASRGARPVEVPMFDRLDERDFDLERELEARRTERTVAIYINTPHNPTGKILPPAMIDVMARFAKKHGLWVIADEAYEDLVYDGERRPSLALHPELEGRVVLAHTMSKGFAMAGSRIGWLHGPAPVVKALRGVATFHSYCSPHAIQLAAARTLDECEAWQADVRREYAESGRKVADALGIDPPRGGTFLFFDASPYLARNDPDAIPFLERAIEHGVMLTPGSACGADYPRSARICFTAVSPRDLDDAVHKLRTLRG